MNAGSKRPEKDAPAEAESLGDPELPPTWCRSNLEAVTDPKRPICYGILMPKENVSNGVPYVKVRDIKGGRVVLESLHRTSPEIASKYKRSSLRAGDLLLSIRGTYGRVAPVPKELDGGNITQDTARLAIVLEVAPKFIAYQLISNSVQNYFKQVARGVAVKGVNIADVKLTPIRLAPLSEQRRITDAIDEHVPRLDAGIAALKSARARLRRYRASVLKAACEGRLVPTEAELARAEGRDYEPADRLLSRILQHRRSRWEADHLAKLHAQGKPPKDDRWKAKYQEPAGPSSPELDDLAEGWIWVMVDALLVESLCNGISVKGSDSPPGVPALRLNAMSDHGFDYSTIRYLPIGEDIARDLEIVEGDFFVSRGNGSLALVGRGTLAQEPPFQIVFPDTMIRLRFNSILRESKWIKTIWSSRLIRRQIEDVVKTTAGIWKVSQPQVASILIPLPPLAEQHRIVAEVERRLSLVDDLDAALAAGLKRADRLRQAILKRAFSGRLVPQDPADEPASALLERIRADHEPSAPKTRTSKQSRSRPTGPDPQPSLFD